MLNYCTKFYAATAFREEEQSSGSEALLLSNTNLKISTNIVVLMIKFNGIATWLGTELEIDNEELDVFEEIKDPHIKRLT